MLLAAIPAADVLRAALFKRRQRETFHILIVIACLTSCRRGRVAIRYTICKVASPISFLLWCLGLKRRRDDDADLLQAGGSEDLPQQRRRGAWRNVIGRRRASVLGPGDSGREPSELERAGSLRLAALGEGGRLLAFDKLRELQREGVCCDVTLAVGGKHFKAHKCVLAAQSFPLRAMFEGAFREGSEDVVALGDVEPSSFSLLLDFFYNRSVEVTGENVEALLDLSARYGVSLLRRHCCAFMARSAKPSNACSLLAVADRYDCRKLRRNILAYTLECFPLACCDSSSVGFCHLSLALVAEVLMDDRLAAGEEGEVKVFWAAVSWLEAERSRRVNADEVLSHVRFGLISAKTLAEAVEAHPLLQTKACKAFVHEAYRYQALPPESRDDFAASMVARARPRCAADAPSASSGGGGGGGGVRRDRVSSALERNQRGGESSGGGGGGLEKRLGAIGLGDDGFSSDESEGGEESVLEGNNHPAAGCEEGGIARGGDNDNDVVRAGPLSGVAEDSCEEEAKAGEADGVRRDEGFSPNKLKANAATASPSSRRSWGAGLRMYV